MDQHDARDRRFDRTDYEDPVIVVCRVCWDRIPLAAERVEAVEGRAYYRCQTCGGSFLIRWSDAVALGAVEGPAAEQPSA